MLAGQSLRALELRLETPLSSPSPSSAGSSREGFTPSPKSPKSSRPHRPALSISSLRSFSDENATQKALASPAATVSEACHDVERELAAIETRLSLFRGRRQQQEGEKQQASAVESKTEDAPSSSHISNHKTATEAYAVSTSPPSSCSPSAVECSSSIFTKPTEQQQAGEVADEVATTLFKCDQLLQRVKSYGSSRVSSISSNRERALDIPGNMTKHSSPPRKASSASSSESLASSVVSVVRTVPSHLAIDEEEAELAQKAAAVKRFAKHCQRDIETNAVAIRSHHQQLQAAYMKELQRKYDSKKHMTLMALREKHEADTKALVRAKMEAYELEEATAVKNVRKSILEERKRALQELQDTHEVAMEEHVARLKVQLTAEMQSEQRVLETQLQAELRVKLKELQDGNCEELERWEIEKRREIELQLFTRREAAVASILKAQEEGTAVLKKEIQSTHLEKEEVELRKLQKALAFGAQAQLQQLRKRLETDHEEKLTEIKNEAALSLERQSAELKQMLTQSHSEQQEQLERDLEKKNRVAVMELHDSMQISHQQRLEGLRGAADQQNTEALVTHRLKFEHECQQELELLEQALDQEMTAKLSQLEMEQEEECELKLEQLRVRAVHNHARELEAKKSRMMQCKNVLLAEASAFLSLESSFSDDEGASEVETEASSAAGHLHQLKKHLSKELAQYVDVMLAEFDELAEEQRILVAKITESTQLYLSYKKRCGVLETQSLELTSGLETLHDQLQKKDAVCKKLYQANEALLKRIQIPVLQISTAENDIASSSPRIGQSPAQTKTLRAAASRQKGDDMRL